MRLIGGACLALLGVVIWCAAFATDLLTGPDRNFPNGFYAGMTGGIMGAGIATVVQCIPCLRNEEKLKAQELKETDEQKTGKLWQQSHHFFFASFVGCIIVPSELKY